jgi:hypothetical protein
MNILCSKWETGIEREIDRYTGIRNQRPRNTTNISLLERWLAEVRTKFFLNERLEYYHYIICPELEIRV